MNFNSIDIRKILVTIQDGCSEEVVFEKMRQVQKKEERLLKKHSALKGKISAKLDKQLFHEQLARIDQELRLRFRYTRAQKMLRTLEDDPKLTVKHLAERLDITPGLILNEMMVFFPDEYRQRVRFSRRPVFLAGCLRCKKEFQTKIGVKTRRQRRFCSKGCRSEWYSPELMKERSREYHRELYRLSPERRKRHAGYMRAYWKKLRNNPARYEALKAKQRIYLKEYNARKRESRRQEELRVLSENASVQR